MINEIVEKILDMFENKTVLSILESSKNYIVSVCDKDDNPDETVGIIYAIDKKTFEISEFSYFTKTDEYAEACNNVIYKYEVTSDELTHWGVKGMRWGVRRYQKKDGSLTPAGKKRYNAELDKIKRGEAELKKRKSTQAKIDKLEARRKALEDDKKAFDGGKTAKKGSSADTAAPAKKSIKDMSDDELLRAVNRSRLEEQYKMLNPEPPVKQSFLKKTINDVVIPAATNSGKRFLENALNKAGENLLKGKADPNSLEALKKTYEKLDLQNKIDKLRNGKGDDLSVEDQGKRARLQWEAEDRAARSRGYQNAPDEAYQKSKARSAEAARAANEAKSREYYNSTYSNVGGSKYSTEHVNAGKTEVSNAVKSLPAPVSKLSTKTIDSGKSAISGLLEGPITKPKGSEKLATYDEDGRFIGYWSGIRGDSDVII